MPSFADLQRTINTGKFLKGEQSLSTTAARAKDISGVQAAQSGTDFSPLVSALTDFGQQLVGSFDSYTNAMSTSALKAQRELIASQNAFNKAEAEAARLFSQTSADKAMKFEQQEAATARAWSEMMSNTAYQRAVADMKAAGLNPVLALGSPAGSGQVSYASGKTASTSAASASANLDPSRAKDADTSMPALIAGLLGSAAKIMAAFAK